MSPRHLLSPIVVAALIFGAAGAAVAAAGDLDPSFGSGGKVMTDTGATSWANAVAVQSDGMTVAAGMSDGDIAVARYDTGGELDPGFGAGGIVTTPVSPGLDEARELAVAPNGDIVIVGSLDDDLIFVARYDDLGTLDPGFGGDGIVTTDVSPGYDIGNDVVITEDGGIVAVGSVGTYPPKWVLARYLDDGTPDPAFGDAGVVITRVGPWSLARAAALQPNQRIVVAGFDGRGIALARFLPNGDLDPAFGVEGKVGGRTFQLAFADAIALQNDGKIVVGGDMDIFRFALARYTPRGRLDPTFGDDGRVVTDVGHGEQGIRGLVILPSGRIVAAGYTGPHEFGDPVIPKIVLARYRPTGVLDPSFGNAGKVATKIGDAAGGADVARAPDGTLVVAGSGQAAGQTNIALARYLP